jgi:short-subunit dehydrogenase
MARTSFSGRTVMITGASCGIGAELARVFAAERARVALVARRADRLATLAGELADSGAPPPHVCVADLADPQACERVVAEVEAALGPIEVLVNNAGLGELGTFVQTDPDALQRMLDVNIAALTRLTRRVLPGMVERRAGWILNIASVAGFHPIPLMGVYAASKAYVISFSEMLHYETRPHGVHVCCVCPGTTDTEFFHRGGFEVHAGRIARGAVPVSRVAQTALAALQSGRMTVCCGFGARLRTWILVRCLPRRWVVDLVGSAVGVLRKPPR